MEILIVVAAVLLAAAVFCVLWAVRLSKRSFRCRKCSREFYPHWRSLVFAVHAYDQYEIRCPHCGNKGCTEVKAEDVSDNESSK